MRDPIVWWLFLVLAACGGGATVATDPGGPADAGNDTVSVDAAGHDDGGPGADPDGSTVDAAALADTLAPDVPDAGGDVAAAVPACVGCHTDKGRLLASLEAEPPAGSEAGCSGEGEG